MNIENILLMLYDFMVYYIEKQRDNLIKSVSDFLNVQ